MKCINCGAEVSAEDSFCQHCGSPQNRGIQRETASVIYEQRSGGTGRSGVLPIIFMVLAVLILLLTVGIYFFFIRIPEVESLTYDELITEYNLYSDDSDDVKNAYYDNVRIEFEDLSRKSSGFKGTAILYAPDMEEIYEDTTDESSIVDELERLSEEDLKQSRKTVLLEKKGGELTQNSAEQLEDEVNKKFMSLDEYIQQRGTEASQSEEESSSSDSSDESPSASASININNTPSSDHSYSGSHSDSQESESDHSVSSSSEYIIADSSSRVISSSELSGLSQWQCRIARNEIYARHGRKFKDSSLQSYFNNCSWYTPTVEADNFDPSVLSSCEKTNIETIQAYEKAHGYS